MKPTTQIMNMIIGELWVFTGWRWAGRLYGRRRERQYRVTHNGQAPPFHFGLPPDDEA